MKNILFIYQTVLEKPTDAVIDMLSDQGYSCFAKTASQLENADYDQYDFLVGVDRADLRAMYRICGGDFAGKMFVLKDFIERQET